jgi:hypothetical protein
MSLVCPLKKLQASALGHHLTIFSDRRVAAPSVVFGYFNIVITCYAKINLNLHFYAKCFIS